MILLLACTARLPEPGPLPPPGHEAVDVDLGAHGRSVVRVFSGDARVTFDRVTRDAVLVTERPERSVQAPEGATLRFGIAGSGTAKVAIDGVERWSGAATGQWQDTTIRLDAGERRIALSAEGEVAFAEVEVVGPATGAARRIVVIGIDTLRLDRVRGPNAVAPGIAALADQSITFERAWSPAPRTLASFRTTMTGRWPLPAMEAPTWARMLRAAGFTTGGFAANPHMSVEKKIPDGFSSWRLDPDATADIEVDRALAWLGAHDAEDAVLFLHFMDPHLPYTAPAPFGGAFSGALDPGPLTPASSRWRIVTSDRLGKLTAENRAWLGARYSEEVASMDLQLARFVATLDALPGRTVLVVHSDHGEELWDHGGYEHNHTLYEELVRVGLWVRPPGGVRGRVVTDRVSLADLAPTLLDLGGVPAEGRPAFDGMSLPLHGETRPDRCLPLGHMMYGAERWGVVCEEGKYILTTATGVESLYDLRTDPGEQTDLATTQPLGAWRERLAEATGWPVGEGWRLRIHDVTRPFSVRFDAPVVAAGVIDPEAERPLRANVEWGEIPEVRPEDVATVTLSEDRLRVDVTPGPKPDGTVYVLGAGDHGTFLPDGIPVTFASVPLAGGRVGTSRGAIIVPLDRTLDHLGGLSPPTEETRQELEALGYIR